MSHRPTWVTDILHFLDEDGYPPPELPREAYNLIMYFGSIVEDVTSIDEDGWCDRPGIKCRRRTGRKPCKGRIVAMTLEDDATTINWSCPACRDHGFLYNWQGSIWDRQKGRAEQTHAPDDHSAALLGRR